MKNEGIFMDKKEINSTNVDETKKVETPHQDSEYQADFSSIFNVESEESVPVKEKKVQKAAPEMEMPKEVTVKRSPEEKAQSRKATFNNDERIKSYYSSHCLFYINNFYYYTSNY